jgi:CheY-like chemotaxis protein
MAKILVVDDDGYIRNIIRTMLEEHEVIEAENGQEALRLYEESGPDLVLMDTMMPDMNGIEATRRILELDPDAKVLMVTAFASSKKEEMLDAGVKEVIPKPLRMDDLLKKLGKYIE